MSSVSDFASMVAKSAGRGFTVTEASENKIVIHRLVKPGRFAQRVLRPVWGSEVSEETDETGEVTGYHQTITITPDTLGKAITDIPVHSGFQHVPNQREIRHYHTGDLTVLRLRGGQFVVVNR